jgi:glutamyl-tRNA reductase
MNIVLLGLNHKTAPIELRERLAIGPLQLEDATRSLMQAPGVLEGMILSTCNRVERTGPAGVCGELFRH